MDAAAWILAGMGAALLVTIEAERRDYFPLKPAKVLASSGFIALALLWGAQDTVAGRWMLGAFALSWVGDALLIATGPKWFLAGLAAFLVAHLAFVGAFVAMGPTWWLAAVAALVLGVQILWVLGRWIIGFVPAPLKPPVWAYLVAITAMVCLAIGAGHAVGRWMLPVGALLFMASDLFVARQRFIAPGWLNRAVGLPLYYGAQLLLAWSLA